MKKSILIIVILLILIAIGLAFIVYKIQVNSNSENSNKVSCDFLNNPLGSCDNYPNPSAKVNVNIAGNQIRAA